MDALLFRTRVSVLWIAVAGAMSASLVLLVIEPGVVEDLLVGEIEGETLTSGMVFFMAAFGIAPLVMAVASLFLGHRINLWVNLFAGLAFGLFGVFAVVSHLAAGDRNAHVLVVGVAGAVAFLIAGLGLAGLRQTASESAVSLAESGRYHEPTTA